MRSLSIWPALGRCLALGLCLAMSAGARTLAAAEEKPICDFEDDAQKNVWEFTKGAGTLVADHATNGKQALKTDTGAYITSWKLPKDWSGYDSLNLDIFVEGDNPIGVYLLIGDQPWKDKGMGYWDRHNGSYNLQPGKNTVEIPVNGLYRGEAGSRNNNIKTNIDPTQIIRVDFGFTAKGQPVTIYLDNMRLVKESRPDGVLAFDFGPESQTVWPGFAPISWNTVYGKNGLKAGLTRERWSKNQARDDTFPTRLYQDFVELGDGDAEFVCDVSNGNYHVWVVYDDCGYWGGETCHHTKRSIEAEGVEKYLDDRGEAGPADYLFRFENVEPLPGDSMWDLYAKQLFSPVTFTTDVKDGQLNLKFHSDHGWSSKIAAVIVYPDSKKADCEKWVAEIEARNKEEFDKRAAFMGPKAEALTPPDAAKQSGVWLGYPTLAETINVTGAPGKETGALKTVAARGQRVSCSFAVRPLKDLGAGEVALTASDLTGPGGTIPAAQVDLRYVHYLTHRGFNNIAYTIGPESLRRVGGAKLQLKKDITRQFWITVAAPADAKGGVYTGEVILKAGGYTQKLPLTVEVLDLTLDEPDFDMGFFGLHAPGDLPAARRQGGYKELMTLLKDNGMNSLSGGPNIPFSGFDQDMKPQLDFKACDEFFQVAKECGFTRTAFAYGGPGIVNGLQDGYVIGNTGHKWEKETGKSFGELLKIVYGAVEEHAKANGWPRVAVEMCDEPRTPDSAKELLESMHAFRDNVPNVYVGGSYSVHWGDDELGKLMQEIFKTLKFSALNNHSQKEIDLAKQYGNDLYIYNQGTDRYSFGEYQWAEFRKGIKGRMQWHLLALHGYQFFDLDGREPDTAMINWGKNEIIPTIHLARCREGADDFRYAVTLYNLAQKKAGSAEAKAALDYLESVNQAIGVAVRKRPAGVDDDDTFRAKCIEYIKKLQ